MSTTIAGKVALVTGGSRGIGRAIAVALAGAAVDVVINFQKQEGAANEVCAMIRKLGRRTLAIRTDVSIATGVTQLVGRVVEELGPIDILINNAGIARAPPWDNISEAEWLETIDTNLKSSFLVTQAVLPHMRAQHWGRIIYISSVAAQIGGIVGPHYAASKAGMLGLMHFYASHLANEGITVNAITPGLIKTDMLASLGAMRPETVPVKRIGTPEEIADATLMLVQNGYITGQTLNIDGGRYLT